MKRSTARGRRKAKAHKTKTRAVAERPARRTAFLLGGAVLAAIAITMAVLLWRHEQLEVPSFDEQRAYSYLVKQCEFGPRVPGSAAHQACRQYLVEELRKHASTVAQQPFEHHVQRLQRTVSFTNLIAVFKPEAGRRILLGAHWDSRPWADRDPDSSKHAEPVLGANDGASGVAVLLEVARVLAAQPPPVGVDLILFDGEDCGDSGLPRSFAAGAQHFASQRHAQYQPAFGMLLDMVGDQDLQIYQESYSLRYAGTTVEKLWDYARRLELPAFIPAPGYEIFDDHVPFLEAGIPVVNIIDFNYPYWHTTSDSPDKCSPASLGQVGKLVLAAIYNPQF